MSTLNPETRNEQFLEACSDCCECDLEPQTRNEQFLKDISCKLANLFIVENETLILGGEN